VPIDLRVYPINSPGRRGNVATSSAGNLRAQEREQLKLALVTFALQLDAFEVRAKEALEPMSPATLGRPGPRGDSHIASQ